MGLMQTLMLYEEQFLYIAALHGTWNTDNFI